MARVLGLDVGERRVGVAIGDEALRMAWPYSTLLVDGTERQALAAIVKDQSIAAVVVGRPRNQQCETTAQTAAVAAFVNEVVSPLGLPIHWQDESVTSVKAEEHLKKRGKLYTKADIDAEAASIILQDYLEHQAP